MALHEALPRGLHAWLEVPIVTDPSMLLEAIARVGRFAKMRTGGTVAEAFPSSQHVVDFLRALLTYDVRAKATAGLHHAVCGTYRLTYEADAATCRMFGFLNVLLAAAIIANGGTDSLAVQAIEETRVSSLEFNETHLVWRGGGWAHRHFPQHTTTGPGAHDREHRFLFFHGARRRESRAWLDLT